jgi:hypothetical protein
MTSSNSAPRREVTAATKGHVGLTYHTSPVESQRVKEVYHPTGRELDLLRLRQSTVLTGLDLRKIASLGQFLLRGAELVLER